MPNLLIITEEPDPMALNQNHATRLLYATQGVGAVFVAVFLAAYLGGLPSTNVLHSEPAFRILLMIFGAAFLVLTLATLIMAAYLKKR